jgi:mannobiose 2-epimerase
MSKELELTANILPYWMNKMQDLENGGFYGRIDGNEIVHKTAHKGAILNARILWTFSAAYRILKNPAYLKIAERAYQYLMNHFVDWENGGVFWELDFQGKPVNTKKQTYAQGFALYGLSEYYRVTSDFAALMQSKQLFYLIERYCHDPQTGGYFEAFTRNWQPIDDMRLSEKDANEKKTMNTHLHILEPYTNLMRIWKCAEIERAQRNLIHVFTEKILNQKTNHLNLFFDENWQSKSTAISYGHDIEASWLLVEAAEALGDNQLTENIKAISLKIADAASEGLQPDGSMIYEKEGNHADKDRHWWVQAEAVVGLMYAWKHSGNILYRDHAQKAWDYIRRQIIDTDNGEWRWSRLADGQINRRDDKACFWKCPYHNGRMCMEIMEKF